jgi:FlaA1/EpsC-like NDP-sugar epimerase
VPFVYTGLRPGEKLREELAAPDEQLTPTEHPFVRRVEANYVVDPVYLLRAVREVNRLRLENGIPAETYPGVLRTLIADATRPRDLAPVA